MVLRKYSTTSQFRLLNQVRTELNAHPLVRNPDGEINLGIPRRGGSYRVPVEVRGAPASPRTVRPAQAAGTTDGDTTQSDSTSFRDRLRAIEMR
jgi:hypothetical protein